MQSMLNELINTLALIILRTCTYFIFFIQKIWIYVLITLGPIAVGMSLIPGFENSLNSWVAKFINVCLYTFIAYTIINIGQQLIIAGYTMEAERMNEIIKDEGTDLSLQKLANFIGKFGFFSTVMFSTVAYLVTAIGVLMTPSIADAIVSAGGAGIMSKAKNATGTVSGGAAATGRMAGGAIQKVRGAGSKILSRSMPHIEAMQKSKK